MAATSTQGYAFGSGNGFGYYLATEQHPNPSEGYDVSTSLIITASSVWTFPTLLFQYSDTQNTGYRLQITLVALFLDRVVNGASTRLVSLSIPHNRNTPYPHRVRVDGNRIRVYEGANSEPVIDYIDDNPTAASLTGRYAGGIYCNGASQDDFRIEGGVSATPGDGLIEGLATVVGTGSAIATTKGTTGGQGDASGLAKLLRTGFGTMEAFAIVEGTGVLFSTVTGTGEAFAEAFIAGTGRSLAVAIGTSDGYGDASGWANSYEGIAATSGVATVVGEGLADKLSRGTSPGLGTATGRGVAVRIVAADGSSDGVADVRGIKWEKITLESVGHAIGEAIARGITPGAQAARGYSTNGLATVLATGSAVAAATGTSAGTVPVAIFTGVEITYTLGTIASSAVVAGLVILPGIPIHPDRILTIAELPRQVAVDAMDRLVTLGALPREVTLEQLDRAAILPTEPPRTLILPSVERLLIL